MPSPAADLDPGLAALLRRLAGKLESCRDPWRVIGSAAMALHGAAPIAVADVDLLLSRRDARAQLEERGLSVAPGAANGRFRSEIFARWECPPMGVEMFAGFHVRTGAGWLELVPETREPIMLDGAILFVPSVAELIAFGRLFGRPKDVEREPLLLQLLG